MCLGLGSWLHTNQHLRRIWGLSYYCRDPPRRRPAVCISDTVRSNRGRRQSHCRAPEKVPRVVSQQHYSDKVPNSPRELSVLHQVFAAKSIPASRFYQRYPFQVRYPSPSMFPVQQWGTKFDHHTQILLDQWESKEVVT